jgi:serine protease DegQ
VDSLGRTVPYLGIEWHIQQVSAGDGEACDIIAVRRVIAGSPACKSGIREGDIIRSVDGIVVDVDNSLTSMITSKRPGAVVMLELLRAGKRVNVKVTLGARELPVFKFRPIERVQPRTGYSAESVDTQR